MGDFYTVNIVRITLHGTPVPKGRARMTRRGSVYTPQKTVDYETAIAWEAKTAMRGEPPFDSPCRMSLAVFLPIPQSWSKKKQAAAGRQEVAPVGKPDLDNFLKSALDGLNKIVFTDDSIVVKIDAVKTYSGNPRIEIEVEAIRESVS